MNTENFKTAAAESSKRWGGKPLFVRNDGFVANLFSRQPGHVIRADAVIAQLGKEAARGCGCYAEIFEEQQNKRVFDYLLGLPLGHRKALIDAAANRGIHLQKMQDSCEDPFESTDTQNGDSEVNPNDLPF